MKINWNYETVKNFIESKGSTLLSTEYKNVKTKLKIKCSCGVVYERCFADFKDKKRYVCKYCSGNNLSYDFVRDYVESKGCKLLSKSYTRCGDKLDIECACGEHYKVDFSTFKKGQTRCKKCYWVENHHHNKFTYEYVKNYIENNSDCILLSTSYKNCFDKLSLLCSCGKEYLVNFNHIRTKKDDVPICCPSCSFEIKVAKQRRTVEEVKGIIKQTIGDEYELVGDAYENNYTPLLLKHHKCGATFYKTLGSILHQKPFCCPKCESSIRPKTLEELQEALSRISDEYEAIKYVNATEMYVKHKTCGHIYLRTNFSVIDKGHIRCPICHPNDSGGALRVQEWLNNHNIRYEKEKSFKDCKNESALFFDFYLKDYNACVEFDGIQHFEPVEFFGGEEGFKATQTRDYIKNNYCKNNNIPLLRIRYDEVDKIGEILTEFTKKLSYVNTEVS